MFGSPLVLFGFPLVLSGAELPGLSRGLSPPRCLFSFTSVIESFLESLINLFLASKSNYPRY